MRGLAVEQAHETGSQELQHLDTLPGPPPAPARLTLDDELAFTPSRAKLAEVRIEWSESSMSRPGMPMVAHRFDEADRLLSQLAMGAPTGPGYAKTGYSIRWEDGSEYRGRIDLYHPDVAYGGLPSIAQEAQQHLEYLLKGGPISTEENRATATKMLRDLAWSD